MSTQQLRSTCGCTSAILLRAGAATCATCGAPILAPGAGARIFTSVNLPPDVRDADTFNRACRSGRVRGAYKLGRVWYAADDAWRARERAPRPRGLPLPKPRAHVEATPPSAADALLVELGATRKKTG